MWERRKKACQRGMRNAERGTNDERRAWAEVVAAEDDAGVEERGASAKCRVQSAE